MADTIEDTVITRLNDENDALRLRLDRLQRLTALFAEHVECTCEDILMPNGTVMGTRCPRCEWWEDFK